MLFLNIPYIYYTFLYEKKKLFCFCLAPDAVVGG